MLLLAELRCSKEEEEEENEPIAWRDDIAAGARAGRRSNTEILKRVLFGRFFYRRRCLWCAG